MSLDIVQIQKPNLHRIFFARRPQCLATLRVAHENAFGVVKIPKVRHHLGPLRKRSVGRIRLD
jgi:hypothetical protein